MDTKYLDIPGEPKAKGRPYVTHTHTFTPKGTMLYENYVKTLWLNDNGCYNNYVGPIRLSLRAYFQIPKSASKKKQEQMLYNKILPTKRPDLDNVIKIVKDALNGIAWHDDSQVVDLHGSKSYSYEPRVEVTVDYLEGV